MKPITEYGHIATEKQTQPTNEETRTITKAHAKTSLKSTSKSFLLTHTEAIVDTTKAQPLTETICTSNALSKTGFKFILCLELQTESVRTLRTVQHASVHHSTRISSRPDVSIDSTNKLVNLTEFQSVTSLTSALKDHIVENLVVDLAKFVRHEESAEQQRFKRRWVQSNLFTDQLARDSRLLNTVASSVHDSLETGGQRAGDSQGHDHSVTLDMVLLGLQESCVLGQEGFSGGYAGGGSSSPCDSSEPGDIFRRVDGVCNNLHNKHWGAAGIPMRRLLPAAYEDGFSTPRVLPPHAGPREVSNGVHSTTGTGPLGEKGFSHMAMQFGQFLDHDITITPQAELDCCNATFLALDQALPIALQRCLNIPITNDTFPNLACFSFTRSDTICAASPSLPREQFNGLTAFIDGSNIYGSDADTSSRLRQLSQGLLKTHDDASFTADNLPQRSQCPFPSPPPEDDLTAGDVRAVVQPTLASMHTLFLNEHNRISRSLEPLLISISTTFPTLQPAEQDEILFQSTRRLVGAELQQIVYREYLPVVLGSALSAELTSAATSYNNNSDPSVMNEFATIAFRFGHSTVSSFFNGFFTWPLSAHFFDGDGQPFTTGPFGTRWQHEMTGASAQQAPTGDLAVVDALRNELFQNVNGVSDDLVARNLQRAREHGIPSYGTLRTACGLAPLPASEPYTAPPEINQNTWQDLLAVYVDPANIDAFTGGLAETAPPDGLVGALFACIIRQQFLALRDGDRYFFTHQEDNAASTRSLGPVARENILRRSLAAVMCDNIPTLTDIQGRVFKLPAELNSKKPCAKFSKLDFECIAREFIGEVFGEEILPCSNQTTNEPTKLSSSTSKTSISSSTLSEPPAFTSSASTSPTASTLTTASTLPSASTLSTESTSAASSSTSSTSSSAASIPDGPVTAPLPGLCPMKDSVPVTVGVSWRDAAGCRDVQGNTYLEGQVLLSCCGCFRYTCTGQQEFSWTHALSPHCCQSCNGTVVASGNVLSQSQAGDSCGTIVTATCAFHAEEDRAVIEEHYEYLNCCADGAGLAVMGTKIVDAGSCSKRTCERGQGRAQAAWVVRQEVAGCTCCQHEGRLLQEGEEILIYPDTLTCCKGQLLNKPH